MRGTGTEEHPSLDSLTHELYPKLVGMLALYTGDRHLAEDLAQEALIRLHQQWPSVQTHPAPAAWASRVALNLARSWWRRRGAEWRANQRIGAEAAPAADHAEVIAIRSAVAALAPRPRAAIVLRFYLGLSVRDCAEVLRWPEGTVKSQTSAAVRTLRRQLADLDLASDPGVPQPKETSRA